MTPDPSSLWRRQNLEWLAFRLQHLRLLLNQRALWLSHASRGGHRPADWLVALTDSDPDADALAAFCRHDPAAVAIAARLSGAESQLAELERRMGPSSPPALRVVSELAGLDTFETDLLLLAAAPSFDAAFTQAYAELQGDAGKPFATLALGLGLFIAGPVERLLVADCLMPTRPLRSLHLLEVGAGGGEAALGRPLAVDQRLSDFLRGVNRISDDLGLLLDDVPPVLSSQRSHEVASAVAEAVSASPDRWATVNLIGAIASGAGDVATQACGAIGLRLFRLNLTTLAAQPAREREVLLGLIGREAVLSQVALLVDTTAAGEASDLAHVVDEVIERAAVTLFVVSGERWPGDSAAHRHMHLVAVTKPSRGEQRALWQAALADLPHSVNGAVDAIVEQFDFGPAAISAAVARAGPANGGVLSAAGLWRSCREQSGAGLEGLARRITPGFGWDDIIVPDDVRAQLGELASQVEQRRQVYERWGFGPRLSQGRGITACFCGASGTGKTMAAEILARHLDLDLFRVDLAGVVSKYIGETEKNLRRVFDAAERSGAILFFDEADALFGTRTEVRDSHDRYANIEVNYLLQRMEDYTGLAILATNRRAALDGAFLRRLRFIVEFPFPGPDDRRRIWEAVFPPEAELDGIDCSDLSRLQIPGGNIRSIAVNAAFLAAADRRPIAMAHVARAAAREYTKLSKPISAAEFGEHYAAAQL